MVTGYDGEPAGIDWYTDENGSPSLHGALATLACTMDATHPGGDHDLVVGQGRALARGGDDGPLLYVRGSYAPLATPRPGTPPPRP